MPLYAFNYNSDTNYSLNNLSIGTMIDYMPSEAINNNILEEKTYNVNNMLFWSIGAIQALQNRVEQL
jgi:hypothetical protein